ncbi:uncharacterized protein PAE49_021686 isoform 1-T1 [Odontesthes bonariensis]
MAEAASSRRRGVVNVRAIKGLFLILSLLCLVQVSSSLVDSDHLDILQDYFQKGKVNAAIKKAEHEYQLSVESKDFNEEMEKLYPVLLLLKDATSHSLLHKDLMSIIDNFLHQKKQDLAAYRGATEEELEEIWTFIEVLDALHSEL